LALDLPTVRPSPTERPIVLPDREPFHERSMELPDELLRGAIDIHVHAGPHLKSSPRRADPIQVAQEARAAGLRAIVLMDVFKESAGTAWLVGRRVQGIDVFGGIILSSVYDGANPRAVKTALRYGSGARFVSLGAHSTAYLVRREGRLVEGVARPYVDLSASFARQELPRAIAVPLEDPVPAPLDEILSLVAEHPHVYLNTGHVSPEEALRVVELAHRYGIARVLVAHFARRRMTLEQQREAAQRGAFLETAFADSVYPGGIPRSHYYVEREFRSEVIVDDRIRPGGLAVLAEEIRAIGHEHFVACSDYGIRGGPTPVEGLRAFITALLDLEFDTNVIRAMTHVNPARLLGLEEVA
jgi:hypothetical protein